MIANRPTFFRTPIPALVASAAVAIGFLFVAGAIAQETHPSPASHPHAADSAKAEPGSIAALFVSDIHFDPFHDPAKAKALVAAPADDWPPILSAPPSADQQQAFTALQQSCHARGVDTPFALLRSSLQAMRAREPNAKFMMVSGDLIAHAFTCRYAALFPGAAPGDYQAFVVKTLHFVIEELRAEFPGMPVYVAMGNNDSGCGDYQLDAGSDFLAQTGKIVAAGLPTSQQPEAIKEFGEGGYLSVTMAAPMRNTRLIAVNDVLLSPNYSTCGGERSAAGGKAEMAWLARQLQEARESGQRVWVMGHIPPGIDPFSTVAKFRDVCGGQAPVEFLSSDKMADLMVEYADVVRLGVFGHTHMDEMRLLEPEGGEAQGAEADRVAVKVVASISPVDGNTPSFTEARVNPNSATLENYTVIAASNQTGVATTWSPEYDFAKTFHEPEFSASTVKKLIDEFRIDRFANTAASQAYIRDYFVGDMSLELTPFWPEYVCALDNHTAKAFAACVCSTPQ
jgi:sphingomyelin phosphodiesterase acid-like 3